MSEPDTSQYFQYILFNSDTPLGKQWERVKGEGKRKEELEEH
jgi:hypothetical protein